MQDAKLLHTLVCTPVQEHQPQMKRTHDSTFSFSARFITGKKYVLGSAEHNKLNCDPREEFLLAAVLKAGQLVLY